ncbi:MAG: Wzz/FepE/Etk N-terminal domain-containing protein, partial [Pseudomonadota bacterium]
MIAIIAIVTLISGVTAFLLPKIYKAEATIMPLGNSPKAMGLTLPTQLMGGLVGNLFETSASPQLTAILNSRTMAERLIDRLGLMKVFYSDIWDEKNQKWKVSNPAEKPTIEASVKTLTGLVTINANKKTQLIEIVCETKDPVLSAKIVNGYLEELEIFINENTFTTAKK